MGVKLWNSCELKKMWDSFEFRKIMSFTLNEYRIGTCSANQWLHSLVVDHVDDSIMGYGFESRSYQF